MTPPVPIGVPYLPGADEVRPFAAEILLVAGILANLLTPFASRRPNGPCAAVTLVTLALATASLAVGWGGGSASAEHFRGLLVVDHLGWFWKLTLLPFVAGVVVMWLGHTGRSLRDGDAPEFFVLLLGATLGLCLMAETDHLLMVFLSIAMASLPSYLLAGFRKANRRAAEAALKYVLFGAVTGAMMVYGLSFLYGLTGTLSVPALAASLPAGASAAVIVAMAGLLVGIGFKISAVPLHFWCPDVFAGAPVEVTTFLSVASKGAALVLLLRLVQAAGFGGPTTTLTLAVLGAVTITVGNTAAFGQANIKRLLAYSSIAQAGYMLCAVAVAGPGASGALLLYLVVYAVSNLGAFAVSAAVIRQSNSEQITAFAGLGRSAPALAISMLCCLVSLIGLPPLGGFWAKLNVLWVLLPAGVIGRVVVGVVLVNTVLSAFYYFRIVRAMYLDPADPGEPRQWQREPVALWLGGACSVALGVGFLAFGPLYATTTRPPPTAPVATALSR